MKLELIFLTLERLAPGIGDVGSSVIPDCISFVVVPEESSDIARQDLEGIRPISGNRLVMATVVIRDGILCGTTSHRARMTYELMDGSFR